MKNIFTLITALIFSSALFAQKASFGVKAGLSSTSVKGDAAKSLNNILDYTDGMVSTKSRNGFFAGGFATVPLGSGFSIEPGLYYSQKGYDLRGELNLKGVEFLGVNATAKLQSNYLDIPLLLKVEAGGLQLFAGPQFSYLLNSDLKATAGALGFDVLNKTWDVSNQFNRWDAGITGGVGFKFGNGINVTAAYDHGLSKIDKNKNMDAYNRGFKVGLGIAF